MSQLILIPVPGTTSGAEPVVRVVVVPKLDAADNPAGAGIGDWPAILAAARFSVELASGSSFELPATHEADSEIWREFFAALPVVGAADPQFAPAPTVRETSAEVSDVEDTYRAAAVATVDPDSWTQPELDAAVAEQLRSKWTTEQEAVPASGGPAPQGAADFHHVLTMLREHPAVLRRLGLVFDLPLPPDADLGDAGTVRVRWVDPPATLPQPVSPPSAYEVHDDRGLVPGRTATARAGLLDLGDDTSWTTATMDIDNAVDRLRAAARSADGVDVRLPPLRSAGIMLLRKGRAADFVNRRSAAVANAALDSVEDAQPLTADDLTLGLRLDVRAKGSPRWTSVMRRDATYSVNDREIAPTAEEEGHLKSGAVQQEDGTLRADEVVARWNGWSLAVPQARPDQRASQRRAQLPFTFDWEFDVPDKSLLALRFGRDYHLRARLADLAGAGVGPQDRDVSTGTGPVPYTRFQPVGSPDVTVPPTLADLGVGGSTGVLVLRSDATDYPRNDERVLRAPRTTVEVAEQHGMLDGRDAATFERVQQALTAGLPDPASAGVTFFTVPGPGNVTADTLLVDWSADWPDAPDKRIRFVARETDDDAPVQLEKDPDVVQVALAPAEQLTLAVSSFIRDGFVTHLALNQWREPGLQMQVVKDGRHPMATPAQQLTFVHAVRRPLQDPAGTLTASQVPDGVSAELVAAPVMLNVHADSTVQLQVSASWTEVDDDLQTPMTGVAVHSFSVDRGDETFREPLVHQFGDTRHRMVSYSLLAVGRFRHLYDRDEDDAQFLAPGDAGVVSVKSTARPVPPAVRSVVPAFGWTSTTDGTVTTHVRSGGTLRVELMRPWHLTGEGEQLAVVLDRSEVARDPIWTTPRVGRKPSLGDFDPPEAVARRLPDGTSVSVIAYGAAFVGDRWVADVQLPGVAAASYRPFVRLVVARYQPESLPDLELSDAVSTDLVQLMPERTLTVDSAGPDIVVRLDGLGPEGPNQNRVDVVLESRSSATTVDVSALGPATDVAAWTAVQVVSGGLGQLIPVPRAAAAGVLRVRVREVELLAPAGVPPAAQAGSPGEIGERVVFTDLVDIP